MKAERYSWYALGLIIAILLGVLPAKLPMVGAFINNAFLVPAYWCLLIFIMVFFIPRMHVPGRLHLMGQILGYALMAAVILVALRFSVGVLLKSLAASGYDLSPLGVFFNFVNIIPALLAKEMVRAYVLGTIYRNSAYPLPWMVAVTLFMAMVEVNFAKIAVLDNPESWFIFIAKDVLPLLAQSCLLSVLVFYGGAWAGVLYSGGMSMFLRVFPFLPSLPWLADSVIGFAFPIIMAVFIREQYLRLSRAQTVNRDANIGKFVAVLVLAVSFVWFSVGVFPIYPSVVLTGSMEPVIFPGDVILVNKISEERDVYKLAENDVINFKREDITITHRIVEVIYDDAGNISFRTKGDNNDSPDEQIVTPNDINGLVTKVAPKVGLPVLLLYSGNPIPEGVLND